MYLYSKPLGASAPSRASVRISVRTKTLHSIFFLLYPSSVDTEDKNHASPLHTYYSVL